jgi:uncharacterized protein (TIGR02444 family)
MSANLAQHGVRDSDIGNLLYDNDFWRFSLVVYGRVEVARECLALQKAFEMDVNLLLFCAWLGAQSIALSKTEIEDATRVVAPWHDIVVRPLRGVRRYAKTLDSTEFESFRIMVKDVELEAEQIEQAMLFGYSKRLQNSANADRLDAVTQNVKNYIAIKSGSVAPPTLELSAPHLIDAACRLSI